MRFVHVLQAGAILFLLHFPKVPSHDGAIIVISPFPQAIQTGYAGAIFAISPSYPVIFDVVIMDISPRYPVLLCWRNFPKEPRQDMLAQFHH